MTMKTTSTTIHRFAISYAFVLTLVVLGTACSQNEAPKQDQAATPQSAPAATTMQSAADHVSPPPIGANQSASANATADKPQTGTTVTELQKEDTKVGTGDEAVAGKQVTVHYTGWL